MSRKEARIIRDAQVPTGPRIGDPFSGVNNISRLDEHNFHHHLQSNDIVLVMFYEPGDADSSWAAKYFKLAREKVTRANSDFAVVNCLDERELCRVNNVIGNIPMYILYSGTTVVGTFREWTGFTSECMKSFVEEAPILCKR